MSAPTLAKPKVGAVAPWYGSNRIGADRVGRALAGCRWVGIPFGGGLCEVQHIDARTILVSDLHRHVINLAQTIASNELRSRLIESLERLPFHTESLEAAQARCRDRWGPSKDELPFWERIAWACDYFVCAWMARNGVAGTDREFDAGLSFRWDAGGGDSAVRFRNATASLEAWGEQMRRCTFLTLDAFDFIGRCKDIEATGVYVDPPFPGPGDRYSHKFATDDHVLLAQMLSEFSAARVVCRFYDCELIRDLYAESLGWQWTDGKGRKQTNELGAEVLLIKNASEG